MQYLLMIYSEEGGWNSTAGSRADGGHGAYTAYGEALRKAGAMLSSNRLRDYARRHDASLSSTARRRCRTGPMPTPRNSSAATT